MKQATRFLVVLIVLIWMSAFSGYAQETPSVTDVSFTIESAPMVGQPTLVHISSTLDQPVEFRLYARPLNQQWELIQDYTQGSDVSWIPDFPGRVQVVVHARTAGSTTEVEAYASRLIDIASPTIEGILTQKLPSQITIGKTYVIDTTARSQVPLEYRYWARDLKDGTWNILQDYSSESKLIWTPLVMGRYQLVAHVRFTGQTAVAAYTTQVTQTVIGTATNARLEPQSETFYAGLTYSLVARAQADAPIEYAFHVREVQQTWRELQGFSSANTANWTPTKDGDYQIVVHAKALGSSQVQTYQSRIFTVKPYRVQSNEVTPSRGEAYTGQKQRLTFSATAPAATEYRVWARHNNQTWVMLRDYSAEAEFLWTPDAEGDWLISVQARLVGSESSNDTYATSGWKVIEPKITGTFVTMPDVSYPNETVDIQASVTGGVAEYRFSVRKDLGAWVTLQDYSENATLHWTPTETGKYLFSVQTRLVGSEAHSESYRAKEIWIKDSTLASVSLTAPSEGYSLIAPVRLRVTSVGGDRVEYRYHVRENGGEWRLLQDYSPATSVDWLPPKEGSFQLAVHARNIGISKSVEVYASQLIRVFIPETIKQLPATVITYGDVIDPTGLAAVTLKQIDLQSVVNKFFALPNTYSPPNLTAIKPYGTGNQLQQEAADAWNTMYDRAASQGIWLYVVSTYRTMQDQNYLFFSRYPYDPVATSRYTAFPRRSEHEMGLAIDISYDYNLPIDFYATAQGKFLQENAHRYGFILRYPMGKEKITGYAYEPWHYRYVGVDLATYLRNNGLTMEEYYGIVPSY